MLGSVHWCSLASPCLLGFSPRPPTSSNARPISLSIYLIRVPHLLSPIFNTHTDANLSIYLSPTRRSIFLSLTDVLLPRLASSAPRTLKVASLITSTIFFLAGKRRSTPPKFLPLSAREKIEPRASSKFSSALRAGMRKRKSKIYDFTWIVYFLNLLE